MGYSAMKARVKAGRCHQHTSYKGLAKPALRMLNGLLILCHGALNFSCYDGDSAPGGLLPCEPLCGHRCRGSPRSWAKIGVCPASLSCP